MNAEQKLKIDIVALNSRYSELDTFDKGYLSGLACSLKTIMADKDYNHWIQGIFDNINT